MNPRTPRTPLGARTPIPCRETQRRLLKIFANFGLTNGSARDATPGVKPMNMAAWELYVKLPGDAA